jgi:hypothetical protein
VDANSGKHIPGLPGGALALVCFPVTLPVVLLITAAWCALAGPPSGLAAQPAGRRVVRPYDLYDPRFCHLTPRPFLCERCLGRGERFVQILEFATDGRPIRSYACWQEAAAP